MSDQLIDVEAEEKKDFKRLENTLRVLWEKARQVSDVILHLKEENRELRNKISSLELKEQQWVEELRKKETTIEELQSKLKQSESNGTALFTKEELEMLKLRLKEMIAKISSRL